MSDYILSVLNLNGVTNPDILSVSGAGQVAIASQSAFTNINEMAYYTSTVCRANCTQLMSNVTLIIGPGAQVGPVSFTQQCVIDDVNCAISSMIDSSVDKTIESLRTIQTPELTTQLGYSVTREAIVSDIPLQVLLRNNLFQMVSSQCLFETNQVMENNFTYIGSGVIQQGEIAFSQKSSMTNLNCVADVLAKNTTYNKETNREQSAIIILYIISIVCVVVFVFVVLIFSFVIKQENITNEYQKIY